MTPPSAKPTGAGTDTGTGANVRVNDATSVNNTAAAATPTVVFGAYGSLWCDDSDPAQAAAVLALLRKHGVRAIDSARLYGDSERIIGLRKAEIDRAGLAVHTKHPGPLAVPGRASRKSILDVAAQSFELMKREKVDVYYLHAPDRKTPLKETLSGIDELYRQGRFERFGLSNFLAHEVDEVFRVARENGFVLPSVYQGYYSAIGRKQEHLIFPVVRKHGMAFYAYSPVAGGFLTKTKEQIQRGAASDSGRFAAGGDSWSEGYRAMFVKPRLLAALDTWGDISARSGVPRAELANRWVCFHSALCSDLGDAIIIGARTIDQLRESLEGLERGPLSPDVVARIDAIWDSVKDEVALDNFNRRISSNL
ncbi:hypothetical protein HK405_013894 [Cladochytrium tenue]|nr:hypothetical protein HK405_013894 [Cladochytrium tenue]